MIHFVRISIITVGMNHLEYLKDLFHSIYSLGLPSDFFEVIYVDNCSQDNSLEYVKNNFPDVVTVVNKNINGFGENNNLGAKIARGEYIAIINPDIILKEGSLSVLFDYAIKNPNAGIIAPKLLNIDLSYQNSIRRFITPSIFLKRALTIGKDKASINDYYLCRDLDINLIQEVNWVVGAAFLIKRSFFEELNGFDEDYFLYMEDEDICLRSWKLGKPVVYNPSSEMIHNHLRSSKKIGKAMMYHFKSLYTFWKKHGVRIKDFTI